MKKQARKQKSSFGRVLLLVILLLVLAGAGYLVYHHYRRPQEAKTTSKEATAQNNYSSGKNRPTSSGNASQGGAVDEHGNTTPPSSSESQWTTSSSGLITLESPITNGLLQSGDTIEGTAKVSTVQYRLVDTDVGVLAQGPLSVVNGSFAGKIQFQPKATTGQLDIFSYDSEDDEINSIAIPVQFE